VDILICKGLTARRLYKSFGVKGLRMCNCRQEYILAGCVEYKFTEFGLLI
jgi:hypothetical protein